MSFAEDVDADASDSVFRVRGLSYAYLGRYPALDNVSLDVHRGERLALLGANGCGKSTLLKILGGLLHPTEGTIHAFGDKLTGDALADDRFNAAFRSRVGIVFQNPDVQVFSATVHEELMFGCLQLRLSPSEAEARVADTMRMLDLSGLGDRTPFRLSGGQKKKVALGSVLVMNPDVILFDEPTAALDPRTQHWLVGLIRRLGDAGKTIVLATHDLHAVADLTDRALVLGEDHLIVADAATHDVLADTETLLSANLIHPDA